jgi:ATP-binding cassette subfamily B protein
MLSKLEKSSTPDRAESSTLQALVLIAKRMGLDITYGELSRNYAQGGGEPKTSTLIAIARDLGIAAKVVRVKYADLPRLKTSLPAIVRVRGGASLILDSAEVHREHGIVVVVKDPTRPDELSTPVGKEQLESVWDGQVILLKRKYAVTDEQQPFGFRWLFGQILRERSLLRDVGIGSLIATVFALTPAFTFRIVADRVLANQSYSTLEVLSGALFLMVIFETVLNHYRRFLMEVISTRIDGRLNLYLMQRLLKLPMDYYEGHPTGQILSNVSRIWQIRSFLTGVLFSAFLDAMPLLGIIPVLFILDWRLACLVLCLAAIIFLIVISFIGPLSVKFNKVVSAEIRRGTHLVESIYGMRTIKSLVIEGRRRREWDERVAQTLEAKFELDRLSNWPSTLSLPFERMIYSGSFCLGAYMALSSPNTLSAGTLGAFAILAMRVATPLVQIARVQLDFSEVKGAVQQVASVLNTPAEDTREQTGMRPIIRGHFEFKNVSFRYSSAAPFALDGVNFNIPAGTMLGVMGRSGSGKTTVARLLQRLSSNYDGQIKLDGVDIRELNLSHMRSNLGVVLQENFLFSGTVRENIGISRQDATLEDIIRAAQLAGAEEFIERMPRGYETFLQEGASNLSGGQRQRLAIARALLSDPRVLILDEATSALDAESEAIVNANLRRIAHGRTVISISHKLSMLVDADAILVLERGKVYDIGTHEELLKRCDIYKLLWYQQNRYGERNEPTIAPQALGRS